MPAKPVDVQTQSLPQPILNALSVPGIDPARFVFVLEAFGALPSNGQIELTSGLLDARGQYRAHRISISNPDASPEQCQKRLEEIGVAADQLLRLLHRYETQAQPWEPHPALTFSLPRLFQISSEGRPKQIWEQGLSRLRALLTDLVKAASEREAVFQRRFPEGHGGKRREGPDAAHELLQQLIEIYAITRAQYPENGPPPAFADHHGMLAS